MAINTKEIITLQIGHYSNFVGAHWWNLQEASFVYESNKRTEVNHNILFREGQTLQGEETYLPRTVIIDCKGSLHSLKPCGNLYECYDENTSINPIWMGNLTVHKEEPIRKNEFLQDLDKEESNREGNYERMEEYDKNCFEASALNEKNSVTEDSFSSRFKYYNLDSSVRVWSDFLRMHLHPRSLYCIKDYLHDEESNTFDLFGSGIQEWANKKTADEIEDRIRFFSEECDYLQAFHIIVDGNNGFSGLGCEMGSYLEDEFSKKNIVAIPVFHALCKDIKYANHCINCLCNTAFALQRFSALAPMIIPLSLGSIFGSCISRPAREFPHLLYDASLSYHSSAILAAGIDSLTLPYRLKENQFILQDIIENTTISGMKIVGSCLGLPFPLSQGNPDKLFHHLNDEIPLASSLMPGIDFPGTRILRQTFILRDLNDASNVNVAAENSNQQLSSTERMFSSYINRNFPSCYSTIKIVQEPCNTIAPFPNMFLPYVSKNGFITNEDRIQGTGVDKVPVVAGIQCNLEIGKILQELCSVVKKRSASLTSNLSQSGIETEELNESLENLWDFSLNYEPNPNNQ